MSAPALSLSSVSTALEGSEPAGVRGGEVKAEMRGLPWGECRLDELGVG